jgi:pyruvate dehydrogenase E1 component
MPAVPKNSEKGIIQGIYKFKGTKNADVRLIGSGPIMQQVLKASEILKNFEIKSEIWSATSFGGLRRDALLCDRWNMLNPTKKPKTPYITSALGGKEQITIVATDHMRAVPDMIEKWVPGKYVSLGTDGFGRSDTRENLRKFFEMDADYIAAAAISTLMREGKMTKSKAENALKTLDINPDAKDPSRN